MSTQVFEPAAPVLEPRRLGLLRDHRRSRIDPLEPVHEDVVRHLVGQGDGAPIVLLTNPGILGAVVVPHGGPAGLTRQLDHRQAELGVYHGRKMMPLSCRCALS